MASKGQRFSATFCALVTTVNVSSATVSTVTIGNNTYQVVRNWEHLSASDKIMFGIEIAFWSRSTYKLSKTGVQAKHIIQKTRNNILNNIEKNFTNNEYKKLFNDQRQKHGDGKLLNNLSKIAKQNNLNVSIN